MYVDGLHESINKLVACYREQKRNTTNLYFVYFARAEGYAVRERKKTRSTGLKYVWKHWTCQTGYENVTHMHLCKIQTLILIRKTAFHWKERKIQRYLKRVPNYSLHTFQLDRKFRKKNTHL